MKSPDGYQLFKVNQAAIILNDDGRVLLLSQNGKWMLPGGRLEENEEPAGGLKREIKEELSIDDVNIEKVLFADLSDSKRTYIITFLCRIAPNAQIVLSDEHQEYRWMGKDKIKDLPFNAESVKVRVLEFLSEK